MSLISATTWVRRGFAAPFPKKYSFDEDEYARIAEIAKLQLEDANEELAQAKEAAKHDPANGGGSGAENGEKSPPQKQVIHIEHLLRVGTDQLFLSSDSKDDDLKEYDLEHYDDSEVSEEEGAAAGLFGNVRSLVYHEDDDSDPNITLDDNAISDDEREELEILETDNLVLAAKLEDEVAHLEVYVYEDQHDNLYVHHDVMLPAIPLALEWLDHAAGKPLEASQEKRNFVAVGTMEPDIEIWDLDTVDCIYPSAILGQGAQEASQLDLGRKKKKKKKSKKPNDEYHVDAVLSLAANRQHRNLLASSSADKTIKLWDLNTSKCAKSLSNHQDKICSLAWNPEQSTVLLSGSYDRTVAAADMRAPDGAMPRWTVGSDVEIVKWNLHDTNYFYVATEDGIVYYFDTRNATGDAAAKPTWTLQAHDKAVNAFDVNPVIPGFLATGSSDKTVKLWDVQSSGPRAVVSRNLGVGKVFSTTFAPDKEVGFRLAVAGSSGNLQIWDTSTNPAVRGAFATKVGEAKGDGRERLVGVAKDDEESDDDNDEEEAAAGEDGWESMEE